MEIEIRHGALQDPSPAETEEELIPVIRELANNLDDLPPYIVTLIREYRNEQMFRQMEQIAYPFWIINTY